MNLYGARSYLQPDSREEPAGAASVALARIATTTAADLKETKSDPPNCCTYCEKLCTVASCDYIPEDDRPVTFGAERGSPAAHDRCSDCGVKRGEDLLHQAECHPIRPAMASGMTAGRQPA